VSEQFHISLETAVTVVVSTVCVYAAFVVLVRCLGPRSLASTSSFDLACVVALGAVLGRTVLLDEPTLMIGLVALTTFFAMQGVLGLLRQNSRFDRWIHRPPTLLVVDGALLYDNMRRAHIVDDEVRQALRGAGVGRLEDVRCLVLERNGTLNVVRSGGSDDPWILADVANTQVRQARPVK
jgi:uncharacterized membrane protein YcaP (DUF421 family)